MKWLENFIQRCYNRARERDENSSIKWVEESPRKGRGGLTAVGRRV